MENLKLIFWYKNNNIDFAYNYRHNNQILAQNQFSPPPLLRVLDWSPPCGSTLIIYPLWKGRDISEILINYHFKVPRLWFRILRAVQTMVLILDGNSEHSTKAWRKIGHRSRNKNFFYFKSRKNSDLCSRFNQMS